MKGLSKKEAEMRLEEFGKNIIEEEKRKGFLEVFFGQFADLLVAILLAAAVISSVTGNSESTVVIIAVLILNAALGTWQHFKAEKSLASLKAMSAPSAKVYRDGAVTVIPAEEIVPGDYVLVEAGDIIPADGVIKENYSLKADESMLTGESLPAELCKGDKVYAGTLVTYGRAEVLVLETGMNTEMGKMAKLMNETKQRKTPLQKSLDDFSKKLAVIISALSVIVFILCVIRNGMNVVDSLLFAIALAVAAIPEALSSIVKIVLALGTQKMAKEHAIIKDLNAVESLGCVSVICSDKTGTLTQNKMEVKKVFMGNRIFSYDELAEGYEKYFPLVELMVLCSDATTGDEEIGDPTEIAMIRFSDSFGIDEGLMREVYPRLDEIAFDSDRKMMSVLCDNINGEKQIITKGAPDVIFNRCCTGCINRGKLASEEFAKEGLRVIAFAMKYIGEDKISLEDENDLIFIGLVAMADPARPESKEAVAEAHRAGIKTVMITGDSKITATAVAKEIGIYKEGHSIAVEGAELDKLTNEKLDEVLPKISVYARVKPEHKIRIVEAWQRRGNVVAMTGDGVNDAPALKKADIGVAMGITGTEVSKDAAGMILADDNFATIIKAVENGRAVYENIKNSISFLLSGNTAGIFCVLFAAIIGIGAPFEAVHLIFMNLLTDSLPAIAIGLDKPKGHLMNRKPRDPKKSMLDAEMITKITAEGAIIAVATMTAFFLCGKNTTVAFATLTLARLLHSFGHIAVFKEKPSKYLLSAFLFGAALLGAVLFIPVVGEFFAIITLRAEELLTVAICAAVPAIIIQTIKAIIYK